MENEYYTPEIEEFCVGFEYEVLVKGVKPDPNMMYFMPPQEEDEWTKCTFPDPFLGYRLDKMFEELDIRVKYLDKSDIESLGWGFLEEKEDFEAFENLEPNADSTLVYRSNGNILHVFLNRNLVFAGRCKNKSELKKLMKQLNIVRWI